MYHVTMLGTPKGKGRPRFANGHAYTPEETRGYETHMRAEFRRQNPGAQPIPENAPVTVEVVAFFPIPKCISRKEREAIYAGSKLPTRKPDADNILKLVCDALNGLAWHDDKQVVSMRCEKRYGEQPMTCVAISRAEEDTP